MEVPKAKIFWGFTLNTFGGLLSRPIRGLQSRTPNPLLQSSEIPNLGPTAQIGNFWLTPCIQTDLGTFRHNQAYPGIIQVTMEY